MPQVVVVGAGYYGLITAKTYLQVTGAYTRSEKNEYNDENDILIIDSGSEIGGTWARDRLYPNLLSQNSYGHYEFSDLPLATAVPNTAGGVDEDKFIPGWKINRYLHIWCQKWDLTRRIRLNWKVDGVSRLPSKQWSLSIIAQTGGTSTPLTITCDKLIIAVGLTSEPNIPDIPRTGCHPIPEIHAKDVGFYCQDKLGYEPVPIQQRPLKCNAQRSSFPRSVAVYGGAKSAFDFIHLFGSLHRNSASLRLNACPPEPVQVHWIIREDGLGPAWMTEPTAQLGRKQVASDQAACTRMVGLMSRCVYEIPKRIAWPSTTSRYRIPRIEGSWLRRIIHENRLGRAAVRQIWKQVDASIHASAGYDSQPKMEKLRPAASAIECTSPGGIANHHDLWDTIRGPNVHIYRSKIACLSGSSTDATIHLSDGTLIPSLDLIIHATGWIPRTPVEFDPPALRTQLGLPGPNADYGWDSSEQQVEAKMRQIFDPSVFKHATAPAPNTYRLFRRVASPSLVAEGDRSLAVMGAVYSGAVALVAEVQALWAVAFLTGGLDGGQDGPLSNSGRVYESIAEDVVWGRLTGVGLNVDAIKYNDVLLRDLGLNPYRMGGRWWKELLAVYGPSSYAGIVEEWMALRGRGEKL
ncbi:hypothetical protein BJX68DRAFT_262007 [Aspergillus pseudodeflectus]|uniref:FAD/NAD(P)-binding domain-containing protein n=1 Tax=Aspergillus pseudodeflectus TaxID=176178 RepID=A0ABR4L533_9EURO